MEILECGKVLNTHGVRGELKVDNYCDDGFFKKIKTIFIGGNEYTIKTARRADLKLKKGQYLYQDLYGFDVYDQRSQKVIGTLKEVLERPASMVYVIDCDGQEALIPAVPPFHQGVDLEGKVLTLNTIEGMLPYEN